MNQCLRCNQLCSTASVLLCANCLSLLQTQKRQGEYATVPLVSVSEPQQREIYESQDTVEGIVTITSPVLKGPQTPAPSLHGGYSNFVEQAINRLSEAARRMAAVEKQARHVLRASRLAPLRDI